MRNAAMVTDPPAVATLHLQRMSKTLSKSPTRPSNPEAGPGQTVTTELMFSRKPPRY